MLVHYDRLSAEGTLETLQAHPITSVFLFPTTITGLIQDLKSFRFPKLRHCTCGGEPPNPSVLQQWKEATGLDIREFYGQTETVL